MFLTLSFFVLQTACGGGGSVGPEPTPKPPTSLQFKIGDAPADRLTALEVSLAAVHVKNSKGQQINVLPATRRLELLHTAGTSEPVAFLKVPQGTYSEATLQGSDIHISYVSQIPNYPWITMTEASSSGGDTIVVPISPPLVVGTEPLVVSVDFDVADFVTFDPETGFPILNDPKFTFSTSPIHTELPKPEQGGLEDMLGMVSSVSGTDFTMKLGQNGTSATFSTDSNTVFSNVSLSTLANMLVKVSGITRTDGSLLAQQVEGLQNQYGVESEGLIYFNWSETPTRWFWITPQDGNGAGFEFVPTPAIGQVVNVNVGPGTVYAVNTDGMDMTGAAFTFDANTDPTTMRFGQRVRVESSTGMIPDDAMGTSGLIAGHRVTLEKQALSGTVSNYQTSEGRSSFVLQLPPESYLTILNSVQWPPATFVNVWQQAGTDLHGISNIKNGDTVRVRGLLFATDDVFVMVAQRIWK